MYAASMTPLLLASTSTCLKARIQPSIPSFWRAASRCSACARRRWPHAGDGLTFVFEPLHLAGALNVSQLRVRLVPTKPVPEAVQISVGRISIFRQST
jgi:hypothetical protein